MTTDDTATANCLRMKFERDALRAEVERLRREVAAGIETERGSNATARRLLDEARRQVADLRERVLHVLDSHGIDMHYDNTGTEVGVQNLITDILAVVGQGVTADPLHAEVRRLLAEFEDPNKRREVTLGYIESRLRAFVCPSGKEGS